MRRLGSHAGFRSTLVGIAIAGGVLVTALTEILSLSRVLTFGLLLLSWGTILLVAALLVRRLAFPFMPPSSRRLLRRPRLELAMLAWVVVVVTLTGLLAIFAVPTNWDSMSYHLARVAHWAQNHSVEFYPTHIIRQLYAPPWAEFAMLQLYVLAGGDRLVNLVQWASMLGSLIGVSLIARQLGASTRGQLLTAFVCATIPMGILQSSTTQNDYAAALWLVCLVVALLALQSRPGPIPVLGAGASLGLSLLTKGTAFVIAAPFVLWFLLAGRHRPMFRKLGQGLVIVLCALALNGPQYVRNLELFGSPLGPGGEGEYRYMNREISLPILASNVLRNLGLHLGTPWPAANSAIEQAIGAAHATIGIAPDDPRSTWPGRRFEVIRPVVHEDLAPNGLHLLLIVAAVVAVWCRRAAGRLRAYSACLVLAFLLFCLLLRWQPWHSRLHLPLFVLGAPVVGVVLEPQRPVLLALLLFVLASSSVYFVTQNQASPVVGRRAVFMTARAKQRIHLGLGYVGAARFITSSGCRDVGLVLGDNDPEYFLWGLLADAGWQGRLESVLVSNAGPPSEPRRRFRPCAIVRVGPVSSAAPAELEVGEEYFRPGWSQDDVQVLVPAPPLPKGNARPLEIIVPAS